MAVNMKDPEQVIKYMNDLVKRQELAKSGNPNETASVGDIQAEHNRVYNATKDLFAQNVVSGGGQSRTASSGAPGAPKISPFKRNDYPVMSFDTATKQAKAQIDPMTKIMEQRTNKSINDQRQLMPQILNARGQAGGGLRAEGEMGLTQDQAMILNEIGLQQDSKVLDLARSLSQRSEDVAMQKEAQDFQRWATEQGLSLQQQQIVFNQWATQKGLDMTEAQNLWNNTHKEKEFSFMEGKDTRDFNYLQNRDAIGDERYNTEWDYQKQQDAIANSLARARVGGGGSSTGQYSNNLESIIATLVDRGQPLKDIQEAILSGSYNMDEKRAALEFLQRYHGDNLNFGSLNVNVPKSYQDDIDMYGPFADANAGSRNMTSKQMEENKALQSMLGSDSPINNTTSSRNFFTFFTMAQQSNGDVNALNDILDRAVGQLNEKDYAKLVDDIKKIVTDQGGASLGGPRL